MGLALALAAMIAMNLTPANQDDTVDGFEARYYQDADGYTMPYRLFTPQDYDAARKYPLILWLHGGGGAGNDNLGQVLGDQVPGTRVWTGTAQQKRRPAFVLVPQSARIWAFPNETDLTWELKTVLKILDSVQAEFSIDSRRIYVAGQSLGGLGVWALLTTTPARFAAGIVVCNAGSFPERAPLMRRTPVWVFQGDKDGFAFFQAAQSMVGALQKAGARPRYTVYKGAGHDIWERVFKERELVDWLFAQRR